MLNLEEINTCKICDERDAEDSHFWKTHKIKAADYYSKYFGRNDLLTNEPIPYKSREQYFTTDFLNKNNLKAFLKESSVEQTKKYCQGYLTRRAVVKKLTYAPCQVELKSIISPGIAYFNTVLGNYNNFCQTLGLIPRFSTLDHKILDPDLKKISDPIIIDTRETCPLKLNTKTEDKKLDYGDYHYTKDKFNIFVERKSLNDFIGTLGKNFDRFCREIERAKKDDAFLIVLVENNISNCLSFNYLPYINRYTKETPDHIFHNVRDILQNYKNIQFLFADGRVAAVNLINKIFFSGENFREFDNQLALDMKLI